MLHSMYLNATFNVTACYMQCTWMLILTPAIQAATATVQHWDFCGTIQTFPTPFIKLIWMNRFACWIILVCRWIRLHSNWRTYKVFSTIYGPTQADWGNTVFVSFCFSPKFKAKWVQYANSFIFSSEYLVCFVFFKYSSIKEF